ncbi:MAG: Gldg family protein [Clostridia bacterium]|nr:Gldg family protein [Clostridia bacterium]
MSNKENKDKNIDTQASEEEKLDSKAALEEFEKSEEESKKKKQEKSSEENDKSDKKDKDDKGGKKEKKPKKEKEIDPVKAEKKAAKKSRRELKARAFRRGWFSVALVAFFLAAVILLNLIASTLVDKIPALVIDTSGSDNFELTEDTLDYLPTLKDDIEIIVLSDEKDFKDGGEYFVQANTLFHEYENNSDKITLKYVDLTSNPTFVSSYPDESLSAYNIIVKSDKGYKYITQQDYLDVQMDYNSYQYYIAGSKVEEAVTSAILNVTLEDKPKVTFISDINDYDYSAFKTLLDNNGFETEEVSPAVNSIPEDTEILVLYTPSSDLDSKFVDTISDFLNNDGNYGKELLYVPSEKFPEQPNIDSLLEEWGMSVEKGYAYENDTNYMGMVSYNVYLYITQYSNTAYTANMKNSALPFCVIEGYAVPVNILDEENASSLFTLSDQSQVVYRVESSDEPEYKDSPNLALGAVSTKGEDSSSDDSDGDSNSKSSHIAVIGSSVALSDTLLSSNSYGNSSYIISLLNTLIDRENVGVTIESKSLDSEELGITTAQIRVLSVIFIIIIPLAVLITGIVIFIKRRNM